MIGFILLSVNAIAVEALWFARCAPNARIRSETVVRMIQKLFLNWFHFESSHFDRQLLITPEASNQQKLNSNKRLLYFSFKAYLMHRHSTDLQIRGDCKILHYYLLWKNRLLWYIENILTETSSHLYIVVNSLLGEWNFHPSKIKHGDCGHICVRGPFKWTVSSPVGYEQIKNKCLSLQNMTKRVISHLQKGVTLHVWSDLIPQFGPLTHNECIFTLWAYDTSSGLCANVKSMCDFNVFN